MVVSPTYFGAVADVRGLREVAHARGVPLVVDEAWGAHLAFSPELPEHALACGADLVVSSTHKIVGSLTQSAMLHLGRRRAGSTSTSSIARSRWSSRPAPARCCSGSLDAARSYAAVHGGRAARARRSAALRSARQAIRAHPGPRRARRAAGRAARRARVRPAAARRRRARHRRHRIPGRAPAARARHLPRAGRRERGRGGVRHGGDGERQRRAAGRRRSSRRSTQLPGERTPARSASSRRRRRGGRSR